MLDIDFLLSGKYKLVVKKASGMTVFESPWFDNDVLDNGLSQMASDAIDTAVAFENTALPNAYAGSGSRAVNPTTDASLESLLGSKLGISSRLRYSSYTDGYSGITLTYNFQTGAVVGNVSEVGVGKTANNLFSRALVRDVEGNPTTITILADEFLSLSYQLRFKIPQEDYIFEVDTMVDGVLVPVTCTIRPIAANKSPVADDFDWGIRGGFAFPSASMARSFRFGTSATGGLAPPTDEAIPSGTATSVEKLPWEASKPFSRSMRASFSSSTANSSPRYFYAFGPGCYQMVFSPNLQKTSDRTMRIDVGYTVGRWE